MHESKRVIYSSNSFALYSIDCAATNGSSRALYPEIRHRLNLHLGPRGASKLLMVWYAFFICKGRKLHSLFPQPTSQCGFLRKGWNNCSLSLHLCDTEKPENPPWISMKKPMRATCGMGAAAGWSGCNILELAMIAEYSGRQVGTHLLVLFLPLNFEKVRERRARGRHL